MCFTGFLERTLDAWPVARTPGRECRPRPPSESSVATLAFAFGSRFATRFPAENVAETRLPGSDRTYEVRDVLREMGLKWDPATQAWRGRLLGTRRAFLERRYGLAAKVVVPIEAFASAESVPTSPKSERGSVAHRQRLAAGTRGPTHDFSKTRLESRPALPSLEEAEEITTLTPRFSIHEIISGLPDDSRESTELGETRRSRDLRGRVAVARGVAANAPGLSEILANDWKEVARFYARFGISERHYWVGIPTARASDNQSAYELPTFCDASNEGFERRDTTFSQQSGYGGRVFA